MYSTSSYGSMISDSTRMNAHVEALRQNVKPDTVVLDIGTGTGIFALLACQFGARRVYAIEPNTIIEIAREIAKSNNYADRIEFIQETSLDVTLPERTDIIISDLRGLLPMHGNHLHAIVDARQRFLKPGGLLIPQSDTLWASIVYAPELYNSYASPWLNNPYDIDMQCVLKFETNRWGAGRVKPEQLLAKPKCLSTFHYNSIKSLDVNKTLSWNVRQTQTCHGLIIWFDATLSDNVRILHAPGSPGGKEVFGSGFFPLTRPVKLSVNDSVSVTIKANLIGDHYVWCWDTTVLDKGTPERIKAEFKQSTFYSEPLSPLQLSKISSTSIPKLDEEGQIDRAILMLMDGEKSLGEIARELFKKFPNRFTKLQDALTRAGELSKKYIL